MLAVNFSAYATGMASVDPSVCLSVCLSVTSTDCDYIVQQKVEMGSWQDRSDSVLYFVIPDSTEMLGVKNGVLHFVSA